jgi:hypothetical protein
MIEMTLMGLMLVVALLYPNLHDYFKNKEQINAN